ncbi:hypothetical protein PCASD_26739, partial [Puccinia coronata f. sp. avenae]
TTNIKKLRQTRQVPAQSSACPPGDELSLAVVLYNPRNINSTPASIKEPPSPPTSLQPLHTNSLEPPSPVDTTEKTTSANPIDKISHARLAPYNLAPLTSTHLLKSNAELLQQLITFPEPRGQIAAPPILASKSHPSDAPGDILHPLSEELPVSDDAPGTILTPVLDKASVSGPIKLLQYWLSQKGSKLHLPRLQFRDQVTHHHRAHTQSSESTLEYLIQISNTDSANFAPGSVSELSDHPVSQPGPQPSEFNIASSNPSIEPTPRSYHLASPPPVLPFNRVPTLLTPTPQFSRDENNPKTQLHVCPENTLITMIDENVTSIDDMVSTSIRNRTRKRLVIEDSDDDSTPSTVSPVAVASTAIAPLAVTSLAAIPSPAAVGSPTTNLAPTPAISSTINLPRAPAVLTESNGATRPHNVDAEMVDEPLHGSRVCGWPDPEGKITAAQIRPILRENGIHYKMADSKAVLLAKYKLLFSDRKGNTPRYDLRQRDLAEINSSTAILNPQSAEVPSAADPDVPAGEPGPINISHSLTHNLVQPNLPRPESQPNPNTHNFPNLIDMEASSAISTNRNTPIGFCDVCSPT